MRIETIGNATLMLGDCREILPTIDKVDVLITSPPYAQQREYGGGIDDWDGLVGVLAKTPAKEGAQILINLGLIHKDGEVIEYWASMIAAMRADAWRFFGWYVWDKQDAMAGDWGGRLAPAHEWIFHFNKQSKKPNKVVQTKGSGLLGYKGNTGLRRPDGSMSGWSHMGKPTQEFKIAESVVRLQPQKDRRDPDIKSHPAVYPVELPLLLIDSFTQKGDTVCDPFLGSGTTGVAAMRLGRRFVGIELHEPYFDSACRRIEAIHAQPDMVVEMDDPMTQVALEF
jgi:DNA modification methylase